MIYDATTPRSVTVYFDAIRWAKVFAPGDYYQGSNLLEEWLRRAGVSSIEELWGKAKKERWLWI